MDKLAMGKVDVVIEDEFVFKLLSRKRNLENSFKEAGAVNELPLFIGFSPARRESGRYANLFTAGIREMRNSKVLECIFGKYGMQ